MSHYKSKVLTEYSAVYDRAFDEYVLILKNYGVHIEVSNKSRVEFAALHFPKNKVIAYAQSKGVDVSTTLRLRESNMVKDFEELFEHNSVFKLSAKFLKIALSKVEDFIDHELKFTIDKLIRIINKYVGS